MIQFVLINVCSEDFLAEWPNGLGNAEKLIPILLFSVSVQKSQVQQIVTVNRPGFRAAFFLVAYPI